mmetsp:Transcript_40245/g.95619  ORF Transcript_40245/g.95619 Transcript_40245/m.95619 type:complete len:227 (+) Transcript_40245:860-1540(+)
MRLRSRRISWCSRVSGVPLHLAAARAALARSRRSSQRCTATSSPPAPAADWRGSAAPGRGAEEAVPERLLARERPFSSVGGRAATVGTKIPSQIAEKMCQKVRHSTSLTLPKSCSRFGAPEISCLTTATLCHQKAAQETSAPQPATCVSMAFNADKTVDGPSIGPRFHSVRRRRRAGLQAAFLPPRRSRVPPALARYTDASSEAPSCSSSRRPVISNISFSVWCMT